MRRRPLAVAAGLVADQLFGEPAVRPHPVSVFGRTMRGFESVAYRDDRRAGVLHAATGTLLGLASARLAGSTAVCTYVSVAGRALGEAATEVAAALDGHDLALARERLPALVGRDVSQLDEKEIARATVESVAENTVDAVVAPVLWAWLGGGAGALGYRAVNTMDAMVGHRSPRYERYGWASARLDDIAGWVPARAAAMLVAAARPAAAADVFRVVARDAGAHPSPNGGVSEAAFAAALGLRLGGENRYGDRVELRPALGHGRPAEPADIARAVQLSRDVTFVLIGALTIAGLLS